MAIQLFTRYFANLVVVLAVFVPLLAGAQVTVLDEPFDDETQFTATPPLESAGEFTDYYRITDGSDIGPGFVGFDGTFFAAQDTNGVTDAGTETVVLEWSGLSIAGLSNLQLTTVLAEDDSSDGNEDWDSDSSVIFQYQIDGGGFQNLLAFESMTTGFNSEPAQDTDFDGLGDGTTITETPATFMAMIAGTGSSLDLRLTIDSLNDGDEDIAIDDVVIMADGTPVAVDPIINEFVFNHTGSDTNEYIEFLGTPSSDYSTFTALVIEGDNGGDPTVRGIIDDVFVLGMTDANGFFSTGFLNNMLENGTASVLLVENFTGMAGDDLDTDDDGMLDATPWDRVVDDIAVNDGGADDTLYAAVVLDAMFDGGMFTVGGASRIPNGTDTDMPGDWVRNDFDGAGIPALDPGSPELGEAFNTLDAENDVVEPDDLPFMCGDPATLIHDVQGSGFMSPLDGQIVDIEGVVVGDFQNGVVGELGGFFIQEEDGEADANPMTSEGIFVFAPNNMVTVNVGDVIRVRGTVDEFFELTEITDVTDLALCSMPPRGAIRGGMMATPATFNLPFSGLLELESLEGMAVTLPQTLSITDVFNAVQFGEFQISNGRLFTPTQIVLPGVDANNQQMLNDMNRILVDDGRNGTNQQPFVVGRDDVNPLNAGNPIRNGYTLTGLNGVMYFSFGDYKIEPTAPLVLEETANPRTAAPDLADSPIRVASANVLNFFSTLDEGGNLCGPNMLGCRGADTASELVRQTDKIVENLLALDSQVIGLIEMENNVGTSLQLLVDGLNAATAPGTWDFIANGTQGTDAIKNGLIYQPAAVTPVGNFAILDMSVDPRFVDFGNRPVVAQTFMDNNGEQFTVAVNHLRSKGCGGATGLDMDQGDGQGCYNETRRQVVMALIDWIATDPTSSGDPDFLLIGDFNSYAMEDPIRLMTDAGFVDLGNSFENPAYSFTFFGQAGTLDFALASPELSTQVLDATHWHSNSDELPVFDYNEENLPGGGGTTPRPADFYQPDAFRAADHDPVVVSLVLGNGIVDAANPQTMLESDRSFVLDDGIDAANITAQLVTAGGMPVPGVAVNLSVTGSAVLGATSGVTDMNGQFTTTLTNTVVEVVTISGQFDLNGDDTPETDIVNGFPRDVSFEDDEDFIFADGYE